MSAKIAKMAVLAATYHIDKPYSYLIPADLLDSACPGMRAVVPFGRGNKKTEAVILSITDETPGDKLKSIESFPDEEPVFSKENLKLALWMSDRFFCTVFDALRAMHPSSVHAKKKTSTKKDEVIHSDLISLDRIKLNSQQKSAYDQLTVLLKSDKPEAALLYGVTGSGKTIIYIKLIETAISMGKSAIVLVPEIALTPQTVAAFSSYFGNSVTVIHSLLGTRQRREKWKRIKSGEVQVVIGTRSAVFAPLSNIGLIVIDEEQEHTYKSDNAPRYHARDIAKYRVNHSRALLLMSSATPSVDSMYAAKTGIYSLIEIDKRFNEKALPPVIIADMRKEVKSGNGGLISSVLRQELEYNFQNHEQSILFVNRRGASPLVACGECGFTFKCRHCSVSMTYHSIGKRLLCHYCGYYQILPDDCPDCAGKLKLIGAGTQKVESELGELFPGINIIRMDADAVTRINSHDKLLSEFRETGAHILLGTQMVTKGLDFENVTLVGVISADSSLYMSDFRAHERTFSLITQVIGRSGRGVKPGRAIVQTFTPGHEVLLLASKQDYKGFFEGEIAFRKSINTPPVCDLIVITSVGTKEEAVIAACERIRSALEHYFKDIKQIRLLGPAPEPVTKVNNKYRYRLQISCKNTKPVRDTIAHTIKEFMRSKYSKGVTVFADIE